MNILLPRPGGPDAKPGHNGTLQGDVAAEPRGSAICLGSRDFFWMAGMDGDG